MGNMVPAMATKTMAPAPPIQETTLLRNLTPEMTPPPRALAPPVQEKETTLLKVSGQMMKTHLKLIGRTTLLRNLTPEMTPPPTALAPPVQEKETTLLKLLTCPLQSTPLMKFLMLQAPMTIHHVQPLTPDVTTLKTQATTILPR